MGGAFFTLSTHLLAPFQAFKLILVPSPTLWTFVLQRPQVPR